MRKFFLLAPFLLLTACAPRDPSAYDPCVTDCCQIEMEELRIDVATVRRENEHLRSQLEVLEEQLHLQNNQASQVGKSLRSDLDSDFLQIEHQVAKLEQQQQQLLAEVRKLSQGSAKLQDEMNQRVNQLRTGLQSVVDLAQGEKSEYIVQSGDTLEKIARRNGTSVEALKQSNNLNSDIIYPRQKLRIP